eukprot:PhM_4_TR10859/c0_g1_i1/m.13249
MGCKLVLLHVELHHVAWVLHTTAGFLAEDGLGELDFDLPRRAERALDHSRDRRPLLRRHRVEDRVELVGLEEDLHTNETLRIAFGGLDEAFCDAAEVIRDAVNEQSLALPTNGGDVSELLCVLENVHNVPLQRQTALLRPISLRVKLRSNQSGVPRHRHGVIEVQHSVVRLGAWLLGAGLAATLDGALRRHILDGRIIGKIVQMYVVSLHAEGIVITSNSGPFEISHRCHHGFMPDGDVQFATSLKRRPKEANLADARNGGRDGDEDLGARGAQDRALDVLWVEVRDAHSNAVPTARLAHGLAEHLDRLDLPLLFQVRNFDVAPDGDHAPQNGAREDRALAFDGEAVVDVQQEVIRRCGGVVQRHEGLWHHARERPDERVKSFLFRALAGRVRRHEHHLHLGPPRRSKDRAQTFLHFGECRGALLGVAWELVGLVQDDDQPLRQNLADDDALGRLRLDPLRNVDDEHHHVDNLSTADNGADQGRVPGAVDESELQRSETCRGSPVWARRREGTEAEVKRYAAFLALGILVEARGGLHRAQRFRKGRFAAVHVPQNANVHI